MIWNLNKFTESNDYKKEILDSDTLRRVAELRELFNNATPAEQEKMAKDFDERVNKYMDTELKSIITTGDVSEKARESADVITKDDEQRAKEVKEITYALENYPNIPDAQKKWVEDMIYGPVNKANEKIANAIYQNKSDKNIEK